MTSAKATKATKATKLDPAISAYIDDDGATLHVTLAGFAPATDDDQAEHVGILRIYDDTGQNTKAREVRWFGAVHATDIGLVAEACTLIASIDDLELRCDVKRLAVAEVPVDA